MCGGQTEAGTGISASTGVFCSQNHSMCALHSCLIHVLSVLRSLVFTFDSFVKENTSQSVCLPVSLSLTHTHAITTYSLAILYVKVMIAVDEVESFQDTGSMHAAYSGRLH